jgi:hypothetical protein
MPRCVFASADSMPDQMLDLVVERDAQLLGEAA